MNVEAMNGGAAVAAEVAEQWRAVEGAPGYEVSDLGRVRSYKGRFKWRGVARVLRPVRGLQCMSVTLCTLKGYRPAKVHRMVLEAFVGPRPPDCEGCHNDGDWTNNKLSNLRWDTHRNNMADMVKHGTRLSGDRHPCSKLDADDRNFIRELLRRGFPLTRVAALYGVNANTVQRAKRMG